MTKEIPMTKSEIAAKKSKERKEAFSRILGCYYGNFGFRHWDFFAHSSFVIRPSICVAVLLALTGCSHKEHESTSQPATEAKEESRIKHSTNGEVIIKLDAESQKL